MMAETQEAGATLSLQKTVMDPEIKMEGEEDSSGQAREPSFLPKQSVKEEPEEGPSGNWDAQLREFVMMLQAHHSSGETLQLPERRQEDDGKTERAPFQSGTEDLKGPRDGWLSQIRPHCIGGNHKEQPALLGAAPRAKRREGRLQREDFGMELRRLRFRTLCYRDAEGPRELCRQLQERCRQWLKPERHTKEQIVELVALEQFLAVLPLEMQSWVRGKDPETCAEAATLAEDFLLSQRNAKGVGQQITGMCEEESVDIPYNIKWVPPGTEEMEVFVETKQGGGESAAALAGDSWLREEEEEKPFWPAPEKMPSLRTFLRSTEKGGCLSEENQKRAKKQEEEEEEEEEEDETEGSREDSHGVCEGTRGSALHQEENMPFETCGESAGESALLPPDESGRPEEKPYRCWHCGQIFASSSDLLSHERNHVGEKLYTCSQCGRSQRIHMGQKPHKCSHCGNTFSCRAEEELSGRKKIHACLICGKAYTQIAGFLQHQGLHRGEKPYRCSKCAEHFGTYTALRVHRKTHTGENQYRCSHCGLCFSCSPHLRAHERTHLATCARCGRSFGRKAELAEHERTHARGDPFACFACAKTFDLPSELMVHVRSHTEKLPGSSDARITFRCSECGDTFRHSSALRVHQRIHTGEKP